MYSVCLAKICSGGDKTGAPGEVTRVKKMLGLPYLPVTLSTEVELYFSQEETEHTALALCAFLPSPVKI